MDSFEERAVEGDVEVDRVEHRLVFEQDILQGIELFAGEPAEPVLVGERRDGVGEFGVEDEALVLEVGLFGDELAG